MAGEAGEPASIPRPSEEENASNNGAPNEHEPEQKNSAAGMQSLARENEMEATNTKLKSIAPLLGKTPRPSPSSKYCNFPSYIFAFEVDRALALMPEVLL